MRIAVLRNRTFRRLWMAAGVDSFGSWLLVIAVPLQVFTVTGSATSSGLALALQAAPAVLTGPWAGVVVDRFSRRSILVAANLASAAGVSLMLLATGPDRVGFVYLGLVVENVAVCFLRPALSAVLPAVVGRQSELASANSLFAVTNSVFRMIGPPLGTGLVAYGWFEAAVLLDLGSYLVAAAIIGGTAIPATERLAQLSQVSRRITRELRDGLRQIARTPLLRGLLITNWVYWTANAALTVLLIPFVTNRLHTSGQAVGYLIAGLGIGYLGGSAISKALIARYPTRTLLWIAYASVGVCFLVMFTATALPTALVVVTVSGVPGAVAQVVTGHRLQTATPGAMLGRVSAAFHTSDALAAVAGALFAPVVLALTSLDVALTALAATVLATGAMARVLLPGHR